MVTKLFAVMPQTSPRESSAVSTATPVAKRDAAWRKASGSARCIACPSRRGPLGLRGRHLALDPGLDALGRRDAVPLPIRIVEILGELVGERLVLAHRADQHAECF